MKRDINANVQMPGSIFPLLSGTIIVFLEYIVNLNLEVKQVKRAPTGAVKAEGVLLSTEVINLDKV